MAPTQIGKALTTNTQQPGFPTSTKDGKPYGWGTGWYTPNWLCELGGDNKLKVQALNISETLSYQIIDFPESDGCGRLQHVLRHAGHEKPAHGSSTTTPAQRSPRRSRFRKTATILPQTPTPTSIPCKP